MEHLSVAVFVMCIVLATVRGQSPFSQFSAATVLSNRAACAIRPTRDWSFAARSPLQCVSGCHLVGQSCVGVNYRRSNKTCDVYSKCPVDYAINETSCQFYEKETDTMSRRCIVSVGPFSLSWKKGHAYVTPTNNNLTVISATLTTTFLLTNCLAMSQVPASKQPDCVSLTPEGQPGIYLRHVYLIIYAHAPTVPLNSFIRDASFILWPNKFYEGSMAFESVNFPGSYINVHADNRLGVDAFQDTPAFKEGASFQ